MLKNDLPCLACQPEPPDEQNGHELLNPSPSNGTVCGMNIDLSDFEMGGPEWKQSKPSSKLPPKSRNAKGMKKKPQKQAPKQKNDGVVRVGRETKGRKGAGVTVITGIPTHPEGLKQIAKELKQKCGSGGTVKGNTIEIQGDQRNFLVQELQNRGYTVKKTGG